VFKNETALSESPFSQPDFSQPQVAFWVEGTYLQLGLKLSGGHVKPFFLPEDFANQAMGALRFRVSFQGFSCLPDNAVPDALPCQEFGLDQMNAVGIGGNGPGAFVVILGSLPVGLIRTSSA